MMKDTYCHICGEKATSCPACDGSGKVGWIESEPESGLTTLHAAPCDICATWGYICKHCAIKCGWCGLPLMDHKTLVEHEADCIVGKDYESQLMQEREDAKEK